METALRIIIAKSPRAALEAVRAMQAVRANSPVLQVRYNRVVEMALADTGATFTADERAELARHVDATDAPVTTRDHTLRVRLSDDEWERLEADAGDNTLSAYVRRRLFE